MILLDVNVLIYAHRVEMPHHVICKRLVDDLLNGPNPFGVPDLVFAGVVRIVTQSFWRPPSTLDEAFAVCRALRSSPRCEVVQPSQGHWAVFEDLCRAAGAQGKKAADAYLAAFAVDRGDEWLTADADFVHFPGLRWRHPWETQTRTNPR